jgi:hypothetical protein
VEDHGERLGPGTHDDDTGLLGVVDTGSMPRHYLRIVLISM